MLNSVLGIVLMIAQLVATGGQLPQVVEATYPATRIEAGGQGEVVVSLVVKDGYVINHTPPMQLTLATAPGVKLASSRLVSPSLGPESDNVYDGVYYAKVPDFTVEVAADRPGRYTVPGELVYFFCSTADGFCARQTLDVEVPVVAE